MAQKLYRVVEVSWKGGERVETEIGCQWKPEKAAKSELREWNKKSAGTYGIQKQK